MNGQNGSGGVTNNSEQQASMASLFAAVVAKAEGAQVKLNKAMDDGAKRTRTSTDEMATLAKILPKLTGDQAAYTSAVRMASQSLVNEHKLLSEAGQTEYQERKTMLQTIMAEQQKGNQSDLDFRVSKTAATLSLQKLERQHAMDQLTNLASFGKTSTSWATAARGIGAQVEKHGMGAAGVIGDVLGSSAEAIAVMATAATVAIGVFAAFKYIIEGVSKATMNAAQSGVILTGTSTKAHMEAMASAGRTSWGVTAYSFDKIEAELTKGVGTYLYDVGLTSAAYQRQSSGLRGSVEELNAHHDAMAGFVTSVMSLGNVYGVSGDEAVRLATKMGTLGKETKNSLTSTTGHSAQDMVAGYFGLLAHSAQRLNVPLSAMVGTMEGLKGISENLNFTTDQLTSMTISYYDALRQADSAPGFQNKRAEDVQRQVNETVQALSSIDPRRMMALNQTPGGTWASALDRVITNRVGSLDDAIKNGAMAMGLGTGYLTKGAKSSPHQDVMLAMAMGVGGNEFAQQRAGHELAKAERNNLLTTSTLTRLKAAAIDQSFDQAKTVGENLAAGGDVMAVIAGTLNSILRVLVEWSSAWGPLHSSTADNLAKGYAKSDADRAAYGNLGAGQPARQQPRHLARTTS